MEFLSKYFVLIIGVVFVGVFCVKLVRLLKKAKKIDREGIETDAVVSRVEMAYDPDTLSTTYTTYAEYKDEHGELRESPMTITSDAEHESGEHIRIKYMPGDYELVREAQKNIQR